MSLPSNIAGGISTAYNADNEQTKFNGTTFAYDADGNLTSDGNKTYTWDARDHLTAISGGVTASFVYDGFGRRMSKTVSGTTTQVLYDRLNPVQELNASNQATANLLTGIRLDEYFARTDTATSSFLADALGSTIGLVGAGGTIATNYTYQPFGATTVGGTANANSYQFTGRENDGTGLYFYRARYYHPSFQRFVSQDPVGSASGSANIYQYAANNPTNLRDPSGKFITILIGAAVGGTVAYLESNPSDSAGQIAENVLIGAGLGAITGGVGAIGDIAVGLSTGAAPIEILSSVLGDAADTAAIGETAMPWTLFPPGSVSAAETFGWLALKKALGGDCR